MLRPLFALSVTFVLATSTGLLAQDTTSETDGASDNSASDLLDMGQPVSSTPALGERYIREEYGDWSLACIRTDSDDDPCSLVQIAADQTGNPVAEMSVFRLAERGRAVAGATVIVPLETFLPAQLTISIDEAPGKRYNYQFCNQVGCVAQIGLTQEDVDAFKAGGTATLTLVPAPAPDQTISVSVSLIGFTAGFDIVDVLEN